MAQRAAEQAAVPLTGMQTAAWVVTHLEEVAQALVVTALAAAILVMPLQPVVPVVHQLR
jgi:hypothetical protein